MYVCKCKEGRRLGVSWCGMVLYGIVSSRLVSCISYPIVSYRILSYPIVSYPIPVGILCIALDGVL